MNTRTTVNNGRIIYLKPDKCDLTAEAFLSYMDESFMPVVRTEEDNSVSFAIASFKETDSGVEVSVGGTKLYTLAYSTKGSEEQNTDCDHPELGTLIYCGNASGRDIVGPGGCDDGVQGDWRDDHIEWWGAIVAGLGQTCVTGVFDGDVVASAPTSETEIKFGDYLRIRKETDAETGDVFIMVYKLAGVSHYALYTKWDPETETCGDEDSSEHLYN